MFDFVKADLRRYITTEDICSVRQFIDLILFNECLWVVLTYRFGRWLRNDFNIPILKQMIKLITKIFYKFLCLLTGIHIQFETKVGPGMYIGHSGMLIVNRDAVIGANCNLGSGVVIGQAGRGPRKGTPVLGDNVFVGVGAKIIGMIRIGDNVAIGANAVVNRDVPPNAVVVGVPARIVSYASSKDFIR